MHRLLTFRRLGLMFLAVFAVAVGGLVIFQNVWLAPGERCEAAGKWYDMETRICAQPISIAEITGRPLPGQRAAASAEKNRELVAIETSLTAQQKARNAEADRQRAALAAQ